VKELLLEDGQYPCSLRIGRSKAGAELTLAGSTAPGGPICKLPDTRTPADQTGTGLRVPGRIEHLAVMHGRLRTNHDVVLLDADIRPFLLGTGAVRAQTALCGLRIPVRGQPRFTTARFQVAGLTELAGTRPLKVEFPGPQARVEQYRVAFQDVDQQWHATGGDRIELSWEHPQVTVTGRPRTAQDWLEDYVRPIAQVTGFALTAQPTVAWVELSTGEPGRSCTVQVFAPDITQQPYQAAEPHPNTLPLLTLAPGGADLPGLLAYWQAARGRPDSFAGWMQAAVGETETRTRFLGLMLALQCRYQTREDKGKPPPLGVQLRTLAEVLPPGLHKVVRERFAQLPQLHKVLPPDTKPLDAWAVMGKIRNNLSHPGPPPTPAHLASLTCLAHTLAAVLTLKDLGLPSGPLEQAVQHGVWKVL